MNPSKPLSADQLRKICDPSTLNFEGSRELQPLSCCLGQKRVEEAFEFALDTNASGFNLFAMGSRELPKSQIVQQIINRDLGDAVQAPNDWVYVHNFDESREPIALSFSPGGGREFRDRMDHLIGLLRDTLPPALESDEYQAAFQELRKDFELMRDGAIKKVLEKQNEDGVLVSEDRRGGFSIVPADQGAKIPPEKLDNLSVDEQARFEKVLAEYTAALQKVVDMAPKWRKQFKERLDQLNEETVGIVVQECFTEILDIYRDSTKVSKYLYDVGEDIVSNHELFIDKREPTLGVLPNFEFSTGDEGDPYSLYRVNLFVDNSATEGTPIIYEENPSYVNLIGRIEHISQMGTLLTDFSYLRAGSLHRANGGYLILDARDVLLEPQAWEALKRVLKSNLLQMEALGDAYSRVSTVSLKPEPIPMRLKVILLGDRRLYYLLKELDDEFSNTFRVMADFEETIDWDLQSQNQFLRKISNLIKTEGLPCFDRAAMARVIEECVRFSGTSTEISLETMRVSALLHEAAFVARKRQAVDCLVLLADVETALDRQRRRNDRISTKLRKNIVEGSVLIKTSGLVQGQVNGLSVLALGDVLIGQPSRITCSTRPGKTGILDVEREAELGGSIHTKGVMILTGYLKSLFLPRERLTLSASLVFEQSYGGVDGDSASSAEWYALLSSIGKFELRQDIAVTGAINQLGEVQAIGGVNEKIEGFYEVCQNRGLTGTQGVMIPESNVKDLMLNPEVVQACREGRFHVYAINHVDDGIEILSGLDHGERDREGRFDASSAYRKVEQQLSEFSEVVHPGEDDETTLESSLPRLSSLTAAKRP